MIEDWALRGMQRWPNVPALFGWLGLDRRGRWLLKGEAITRPQIIDTIGRNYDVDDRGCWYFQNGPQRGYVTLEYAPLILRVADTGSMLVAHTGQPVSAVSGVSLDEHGALSLVTDLGPGLLLDADLPWALERLRRDGRAIDDDDLENALRVASGEETGLVLAIADEPVPVWRTDAGALPEVSGYVRDPQPA